MEVNRRVTPLFQGSTSKEVKETMIDKDSEYAMKSSPNTLYMEGRLCVHRSTKYSPSKLEEPYKDRQASPHHVNSNGQKVCSITDKAFEENKAVRWGDVRAKRMQEGAEDKEVLTPPRKKVKVKSRDNAKRHLECASNEVPANNEGERRVGACESTTPVEAAACCQACSRGLAVIVLRIVCVERETPPTRMLIRKEDAASVMRLRTPQGIQPKRKKRKDSQYNSHRAASASR